MDKNAISELRNRVKKERKVFSEKAYELIANGVIVHDP